MFFRVKKLSQYIKYRIMDRILPTLFFFCEINFTKKIWWKWFQGYFTKISLNSLQPDLSRPPPGFGGPPPHMPPQQGRPAPFNDSNLIPTLPYHDLPAGLMVPLIKMEDSGYKPVDPKKLRYFHEKNSSNQIDFTEKFFFMI